MLSVTDEAQTDIRDFQVKKYIFKLCFQCNIPGCKKKETPKACLSPHSLSGFIQSGGFIVDDLNLASDERETYGHRHLSV